ncbi:MAG TPA: rubredoxin [Candidatus Nanoarchaeia archaeon]|nr:rubredoxin [Candidatus Nanoarchaeia archaeon]
MSVFRCKKCNYKFSPKGDAPKPRVCPYCSSEGTLISDSAILKEL